jgi:glycyl-tRNA synthetase
MKHFKKAGREVKEFLDNLPTERLKCIYNEAETNGESKINISGDELIIPKGFPNLNTKKEKKTTNNFIPGVIEPSFGADRILFSIFEHSYYARPKEENSDDKQTRGVLALVPSIAPYKVTILPLDQRITRDERYAKVFRTLREMFSMEAGSDACKITWTTDDTGAALGKRYARNDELGICFAITIDFDTFDDNKCTLRERDSCTQIRLPLVEVRTVLVKLIEGEVIWSDMRAKYPEQHQTASIKVGV